jgi:hypothetical protein
MLLRLLAPLALIAAVFGLTGGATAQNAPVIRNVEDCAQFASRSDRQVCAQTFVNSQSNALDDDDEDDMSGPTGGGSATMDPEDDDEDDAG